MNEIINTKSQTDWLSDEMKNTDRYFFHPIIEFKPLNTPKRLI